MGDFAGSGLPILAQHLSDLSDYRKFTVSGSVPVTGKIADQARAIIAELMADGMVPSREGAQ